ncbi:hypothetical protein [Thermoactinospora rubra]|uniref:hypothetical protein n=1 Tax=Thermoactinospora rubra TaxID=1088767 RepID=UPI000A110130|nr:hypothetical protein [Thermoactinospora rubra]
MLGDLLEQEQGQATSTRVLPFTEGQPPTVEVSFEAKGRVLDTDITDMGTYTSVPRPDGTLFGEGQGVMMSADGDVVTWRGQGIGRITGAGGGSSWRGAIYYRSESERFARINGCVGVFEFEVDDSGKTSAQVWEWK